MGQLIQLKQNKMENINTDSKRSSRFSKLRGQLKALPLMKQKSQGVRMRYQNLLKPINRHLSGPEQQYRLSDTQSSSRVTSDQEGSGNRNCFLQKYELLEKLGEGGNASVYKCIYKPNGKFYAAKKFRIQEEHVQQLKRNFLNMKQLNHPSICKYRALYFDYNQRFAFLVMEYIPFPSLADYKIQSQEQLKIIVKQTITAITYIHNRNMCHRDIKPQNILYNQFEKKIKIIDFGISKKTFSRGVRRDLLTIIGTHFYLAPEVYLGGGYDQRVDLWALGVTIYKLIAGVTPFQSQYHSDTVANILKGQVVFEDQIWRKCSPFARTFVSHLLKKRQQRLSLIQLKSHLWFQSKDNKKHNLVKNVTHNINLNEIFHNQFDNNITNANSKEQGANHDNNILYKNIKLINQVEFDLEDSQDQAYVVTIKALGYNQIFSIKSLPSQPAKSSQFLKKSEWAMEEILKKWNH